MDAEDRGRIPLRFVRVVKEKAQVSRLCRRLRSSSWTDQHRRPSAVTFDSMCMRATRESDRPPSRSKTEPQARWTMRSERQLLGCFNLSFAHTSRGQRPAPERVQRPIRSAAFRPARRAMVQEATSSERLRCNGSKLATSNGSSRRSLRVFAKMTPRADANYRRPAHAGRNARARHVLRHALKRSRRTCVSIAPARTACTRRVL